MPRILIMNTTPGETGLLKEAFQDEPTFKMQTVPDLDRLHYYMGLWQENIDLVFFGLGEKFTQERMRETLNYFDDMRYAWPKLKVLLVSIIPEMLEEAMTVLQNKVVGNFNISAKTGLPGPEIVKKTKDCLAAIKAKKEDKGRTPGILIVDDDPSILLTTRLVLNQAGNFKIWQAGTINDALNMLTNKIEDLDVCIIDYNLEGITADKLIKAIKNMEPRLKIIVVTGQGSEKNMAWADKIVNDVFRIISKPFNNEELTKIVNEAVHTEISQKPQILVIDDSPETTMLLEALLKDTYKVFNQPDGDSGIEKFKEIKPNLVILDYKLPGKNGIEVFKELKKIKPDQKVVIITIEKDPKIAKEFINLGVDELVYKPLGCDELRRIITDLLEK